MLNHYIKKRAPRSSLFYSINFLILALVIKASIRLPKIILVSISHATPIGVVEVGWGSFIRKLRKLAYGYAHVTSSR